MWQTAKYDAFAFMGARRKSQRLRHSVEEISQSADLRCHHSHDRASGRPTSRMARGCIPPMRRRNIQPPLTFAIATSVRVRVGKAKLGVPRWSWVDTAGRREHWLMLRPEAPRSWLMAPLAITLGLRPYRTSDRSITLTRKTVQQWILVDRTLAQGHVSVRQGHHSHRLPVTKWASPLVPGDSCSGSDWLPLYVEHIIQHLQADLHELRGCVLVCDCPLETTCEADVLARLLFEECRAAPFQRELTRRGRRKVNLSGTCQVTMALAGLPAAVADVIPYPGGLCSVFRFSLPGQLLGLFSVSNG